MEKGEVIRCSLDGAASRSAACSGGIGIDRKRMELFGFRPAATPFYTRGSDELKLGEGRSP